MSTIKNCEELFNSNLTKQQKENLVQSNTEIYFLAIVLSPFLENLDWQIALAVTQLHLLKIWLMQEQKEYQMCNM